MDIPLKDLQYVTSLEEIVWGGALVAVTMACMDSECLLSCVPMAP